MAAKPQYPTLSDYPARGALKESHPIISVITSVRNGEKTLLRTITSVAEQALPGLEYIIADAASTDGTLDIIKANTASITYWISAKDRGISDGFNKGIALSAGKYVLLLNADDWLSHNQLTFGIETLERSGADFVFGDLLYHNPEGKLLHRIRGETAYASRLPHVMPGLNHPTMIIRRTAYEKYGLYDLRLRYAMDYEFLLRLHLAGCRGVYDPRMLGHMSLEGASDLHAAAALRETRDISIRHGYPATMAYVRYVFRRLKSAGRRSLRGLPRPLFTWLRSLFNRNYIPAES